MTSLTHPAWSQQEVGRLLSAWREGLPIASIASEIGRTPYAVMHKAREAKLPPRFAGNGGPLWTEEEDRLVIELWLMSSLSAAQIGKEVGKSKNAIIGRMHRKGLSGKKGGGSLALAQPKRQVVEAPRKKICAWPVGIPGEPDFHLCGSPDLVPGKPYCAEHCAVAFRPIQET